MSVLSIGLLYGGATLVVMFIGMPIAFALGAVATLFMIVFMPKGSVDTITQNVYEEMASITLLSIPLFILKGSAIGRSRAGQDLYGALHAWMHWIPGGLGIANVFACALFAAMAGSSPATCSAIGSAGIPEMRKHGYSPGFAAGIIAAGGTPCSSRCSRAMQCGGFGWIVSLQLSRWVLLAAILLMVIVLGFFLPPVSIILMTAPIILPPLKAAGFDLVCRARHSPARRRLGRDAIRRPDDVRRRGAVRFPRHRDVVCRRNHGHEIARSLVTIEAPAPLPSQRATVTRVAVTRGMPMAPVRRLLQSLLTGRQHV